MKCIIGFAVICVILLQTVNADEDRKFKRPDEIVPRDCPEHQHWEQHTSICRFSNEKCNVSERGHCKEHRKQYAFGCYCDDNYCRAANGACVFDAIPIEDGPAK